ncbi:MAG: hypothetical protein JWR27_1543 [Aeromicrobium sp.]|jgi:hypothetical protein|nr:hypothetical protein [Aeromicrobium sp.]
MAGINIGLVTGDPESYRSLAFLGLPGWRRAAYIAAIAFHGALLVLSWGLWFWAVPALALLAWGKRHDPAAARGDDEP